MSHYIDIPSTHLSSPHTPSHSRAIESHIPNGSIPRVTRMSYGLSSGSLSQPMTRPDSSSLGSNLRSPPPIPPEFSDAYSPWAAQQSFDTPHSPWIPGGPRPMPHRSTPNTSSRFPTTAHLEDQSLRQIGGGSAETRNFISTHERNEQHEYQGSEESSDEDDEELSQEGTEDAYDSDHDHMTIDPENMTADAHGDLEFATHNNVNTPPRPQPKRKGQGFVGGFVAGLKWFPNVMSRRGQRELDAIDDDPVIVENSAARAQLPEWHDRVDLAYEVPPPNTQYVQQIPVPGSTIKSETTSPPSSGRRPTQSMEQAHNLGLPQELPNPHESQELHPPAPLGSPIQIDPQPTSDYERMSSRGYSLDYSSNTGGTASSSSHAVHVGKVLGGLRRLPWISTRVAAEYVPSESTRAQFDKPVGSWYSKHNPEKLDLLETPIVKRAPPRQKHRQDRRPVDSEPRPEVHTPHRSGRRHHHHRREHHPRSEGGATAIRPTRTPASATSGGVLPTSPGASSHGLDSHSYSCNYYYSPQQPLYLYPQAIPQPIKHEQGGGSPPPPEMPQPVPVIMMAAPGTYMMPISPAKGHHRPNHHQHMSRPHPSRHPPHDPRNHS